MPTFLLMLLLAASYHAHTPVLGIQGATLGNMLPGAVGLLLNCIILSTLTIVLSIPIATRRIQIVFLTWLAAVLYSNSSPSLIARYLSFAGLPLAPIVACYTFGSTSAIDGYALVMLLLAVGYILGLAFLANFWMRNRDLIFF